MTRAKILDHYEVDQNGVITSPGKFEGEPIWVLYFWELVMDGFGDDEMDCGDCEYKNREDNADICGNCDSAVNISSFTIEASDIQAFPELTDDLGKTIRLWTCDQGFVYSEIV